MKSSDVTTVAHQPDPATGQEPPGSPTSVPGSLAQLLRRVGRTEALWVFGVLVVLVVIFDVTGTNFLTPFNARSMGMDASLLLIMGVGATFVIITGGIDLSIGSVLVFSGVCSAKLIGAFGGYNASVGAIILAFLVGILSGLGWGLLNGFVVAKADVPPLVVTLGSFGAALGLAEVLTSGEDLRDVPLGLTSRFGLASIGGIPWLVVICAVIVVIGGCVLAFTTYGIKTYALGSNAEATRRAGIKTDRHIVSVYAMQGLLAGIAGVLSLARFGTTTLTGHSTDNLSVIASVVIGGTSLFGGTGTMFGTVVGIFIPVVLSNGFVNVGLQSFWQQVAVGVVLVVAVYIDRLRRKSQKRS